MSFLLYECRYCLIECWPFDQVSRSFCDVRSRTRLFAYITYPGNIQLNRLKSPVGVHMFGFLRNTGEIDRGCCSLSAAPLDFCRGMSRPVIWYRLRLRHVIRHVANVWVPVREQAMLGRLCAGSFFGFFSFSLRTLRYYVLSALHLSEFKRFDGSIYRNLRGLSMFINTTWLWDVNRWNTYIFDCTYWLVPVATDSLVFIRSKFYWETRNCKGPHTINATNVGSTRDLISQKSVWSQTIDCKADTTWKTFRDTNMKRTDKVGSQQWTAVSPFLGLVSTV